MEEESNVGRSSERAVILRPCEGQLWDEEARVCQISRWKLNVYGSSNSSIVQKHSIK